MKKAIHAIKRLLAGIPSQKVVATIMLNSTADEDGTLRMSDGTKIGRIDRNTGIGWCSLPGYIRLCRSLKKASVNSSVVI